jgi:hypothetical protein
MSCLSIAYSASSNKGQAESLPDDTEREAVRPEGLAETGSDLDVDGEDLIFVSHRISSRHKFYHQEPAASRPMDPGVRTATTPPPSCRRAPAAPGPPGRRRSRPPACRGRGSSGTAPHDAGSRTTADSSRSIPAAGRPSSARRGRAHSEGPGAASSSPDSSSAPASTWPGWPVGWTRWLRRPITRSRSPGW